MDGFRIQSTAFREFLAELLGTFTLTCIGCCTNAFITVADEGSQAHAIAPWGWGMALTAAIYICGGVSGGHVNPAVTLGMASVGKLPWSKVLYYFLGQYIGAFLGAAVTYLVYYDVMSNRFGDQDKLLNTTAGIFGTLPHKFAGPGTCVIDQIVAVSFFLMIINAITDKKNMNCPKGLIPIAIGVTDLGLLIFAFGFNAGAPINPARDFAPRLFTMMAGWGKEPMAVSNYNYFWIPIVACHIGGILGSWLYKLFIENHWPTDSYDLDTNHERSYVEMSQVKAVS